MHVMKKEKAEEFKSTHNRMWTEFVILHWKMIGDVLLMRHEFYMEGI